MIYGYGVEDEFVYVSSFVFFMYVLMMLGFVRILVWGLVVSI